MNRFSGFKLFLIIEPLEGLQHRRARLLSNKSTAPTWQGWSLKMLRFNSWSLMTLRVKYMGLVLSEYVIWCSMMTTVMTCVLFAPVGKDGPLCCSLLQSRSFGDHLIEGTNYKVRFIKVETSWILIMREEFVLIKKGWDQYFLQFSVCQRVQHGGRTSWPKQWHGESFS